MDTIIKLNKKKLFSVIKLILFFLIILTSSRLFAEKPLIGIITINNNTFKGKSFSKIIQDRFENIIKITGVFDSVNPQLLSKELIRYNCIEEKCILRFARNTKIDIILLAEIIDKNNDLILKLSIFGTAIPFSGKLIYSKKIKISLKQKQTLREYSFILEEHAGYFISNFFLHYKHAIFLKKSNNKIVLNSEKKITGKYRLYSFNNEDNNINIIKKENKITIQNNIIQEKISPIKNHFILIEYNKKSKFLEEYYTGRKKELIFNELNITDTLYSILFTIPASASMPIAAPILGYYQNSDWQGLFLWSLNVTPYLYIEYNGLTNKPEDLEKHNRNIISSRSITNYRFGLYMLYTGGISIFVDSFANKYLEDSSDYLGIQPLVGNTYTAAYLSLISGGGGHFYRGYRGWGYFYFHLNNVLLYLTINQFSPEMKYNAQTDSYEKNDIDKKKAYIYASAYGVIKLVEIIHSIFLEDNIKNGTDIEENIIFTPLIYSSNDQIGLGIKSTFRF